VTFSLNIVCNAFFPCLSDHFLGTVGKSKRFSIDCMYKQYEPVNLQRALEAVFSNKMTQHQAARHNGLPQTTISRRLSKYILQKMKSGGNIQ
jgi:transcriptional regulator with AAA-type ATPase domain